MLLLTLWGEGALISNINSDWPRNLQFSYHPHTTYQYQVIYLQLSLCTQHSAGGTVLLNKGRGGWSSQSKKRPNVAFISGL